MWNTENQPVSVGFQGTIEYYTYDADNARIKKTRGSATTYYTGGMYEEEVAGNDTTTRSMYAFNGQVVAQRTSDSKSSTLIYLHGDHLGSVGAATGANGALVSQQEYDPWGKVRSGGIGETKYNYTGQKLDDTGLLFYNARYYDPLVARFVSPDSIMSRVKNNKLTVDFHENALLASGSNENMLILKKGFWFQLSGDDRDRTSPSGPSDPQVLNRYSYGMNNPLRYSDPTGHITYDKDTAKRARSFILNNAIPELEKQIRETPINRIPFVRDLLNFLSPLKSFGLGFILNALEDPYSYEKVVSWLRDYARMLDNFIDDPIAATVSIQFGAYGDASWVDGYFMVATLYDADGSKLPGFHDFNGVLQSESQMPTKVGIPGVIFWSFVGTVGIVHNNGRVPRVE